MPKSRATFREASTWHTRRPGNFSAPACLMHAMADTASAGGIAQERISLICPVTLRPMEQPCRSAACASHAGAFCSLALPHLKVRSGSAESEPGEYRCPICDKIFAERELQVDGRLAEFIAEHPGARQAVVKRGSRSFSYRLPPTQTRRSHVTVEHRAECDTKPAPRNVDAQGQGGTSSTRARPIPPLQGPLPPALPPAERARRRSARREERQRATYLSRCRELLIRRALHEEHPESTGDCLWR